MLECFKNIYIKNIRFNIVTIVTFILMMFVANSTLYDNYRMYRQLTYLDDTRHDFYYINFGDKAIKQEKLEEVLNKQNFKIARYELTLNAQDEKGNEFYLYEANSAMLQIEIPVKKGRWIQPDSNQIECIIGTGLSRKYKMGDSILISGNGEEYRAKIVGVLNDTGYLLRDNVQTNKPELSDLLTSYGGNICITNRITQSSTEPVENVYLIPEEISSNQNATMSVQKELQSIQKNYEIYSYSDIKDNTQRGFKKSVTTSTIFILLILVLISAMMCFCIYTTTYCQRDTIEIYCNCGATRRQITIIIMMQTTVTLIVAVMILLAIMVCVQSGARGNDMFGSSIIPHVIWTGIYSILVEMMQFVFIKCILSRREDVMDTWK